MSGGIYKGGGGGRRANLEWSKKGALRAGGVAPTGTAVDFLLRFNTGNALRYSVASLNANTIGLASGSWSLIGAGANHPAWGNSLDADIPGFSVAGVGYGDPTPGHLTHTLEPAPSGSPADACLWTFGSTKANLVLGYAFRIGTSSDSFGIFNTMRVMTAGSDFGMMSIEIDGNTDPDVFRVRCHCDTADGGLIENGGGAGLTMDTWYWATMQFLASSASVKLRLYTYPGFVQIGSESIGTKATSNGTQPATAVRVGLSDVTGGEAIGSDLIWDDVVMKYSNVYPLLPS